jgi:hypothetical protein
MLRGDCISDNQFGKNAVEYNIPKRGVRCQVKKKLIVHPLRNL